MKTKVCKQCNEEKAITDFYMQNIRSKSKGDHVYYNPICKACVIKKARQRNLDNYEEFKRRSRDDYRNGRVMNVQKQNSENRRLNGKFKEWQKQNPEKLKGYGLNHKTHIITKKEWLVCKEYFNNECAYCGLPIEEHYLTRLGITKLGDFHKEHVDHEGSNDLSNCVPSCKSCNSSKHTSKLENWYDENNPNFKKEKLDKIYKWIDEDSKPEQLNNNVIK